MLKKKYRALLIALVSIPLLTLIGCGIGKSSEEKNSNGSKHTRIVKNKKPANETPEKTKGVEDLAISENKSNSSLIGASSERLVKLGDSISQAVLAKKTDSISKKESITYIEEKGSFIIYFKNRANDTVEFDVIKNNPYNNLSINVPAYVNDLNYKLYEVLDSAVNEDVKKQLYISSEYEMYKNFKISSVESAQRLWINGDFAVLVYSVYTNTGDYSLIGDRGIAIIFNKYGEEVQRFDNLDIDLQTAAITSDGRFVGFSHSGFETVYDAALVRTPSFTIYEVATKKKVYGEVAPEGVLTGGVSVDEVNMFHGRFAFKRILINPYDRILYSNFISPPPKKGTSEYEKRIRLSRERIWVRRTKTGIIFRIKSTGEEFLRHYDTLYDTKKSF